MHRRNKLDIFASQHFERPSDDTCVHLETARSSVELLACKHFDVRGYTTEFVALDVDVTDCDPACIHKSRSRMCGAWNWRAGRQASRL